MALQTKMKRTPSSSLLGPRAQEKRQQETEQKLQEKEKESGAVAKPLEEQMVQTEPQCEPFDSLDESLFIPGRAKEKKTRSQKRQQRLEHARQADTHSLEITAADLQKLQGADPTLEAIRKIASVSIASGESGLAGNKFFERDGILYRKYIPPGSKEESDTLD